MLTHIISILAVLSHVVFVFLLLSLAFRKSWGKDMVAFFGRHALLLAFIAALTALFGSLYYSEILGYEPCSLCWWQRVLMFPQAVLFLIALKKRNRGVFGYLLPLSIISAVVALYQTYANLGGTSILPCTAAGSACAKLFFVEFGYITIPSLSLTIALYLILLTVFNKVYVKDHSHA